MVMPKLPKEFCIDSFEYKEYQGDNNWSEPVYADAVTINHCRIDRGSQYTSATSGKQLLYNALIFCYAGITEPLLDFKAQSMLVFDGKEHVVTKVIPVYEAYSQNIYSYELEVV